MSSMRVISSCLCSFSDILKSKYFPKYRNDSPVLVAGINSLLIRSLGKYWIIIIIILNNNNNNNNNGGLLKLFCSYKTELQSLYSYLQSRYSTVYTI